jgi:hypothetical protein
MSVALNNISLGVLTSLTANLINNAETVGINTGALGALNTAENLASGKIIRLANDDGTGHQKQVRVVTKQRQTADDTVSSKDCTPGSELLYEEEVVTITDYVGGKFLLNESTVRQYDSSYSELVRLTGSKDPRQIVMKASEMGSATTELSVIREMFSDFQLSMDAMIQAVNKKILAYADAAKGTWVGGAASNSYVVQNGSTYVNGAGSINAGGLLEFRQDARATKFNGLPHIISGYGAMDRIFQQDSRYFGPGANGFDFASVRGAAGQEMRLFTDENVVDQFSSEDAAIVFMPGSMIYLPFLQYVGNFGDIGVMKRFTMPIPQLPNVSIDVRILPDECSENYAVFLDQFFEIFTPSMELFKSTDRLTGVNGVFEAAFTQA